MIKSRMLYKFLIHRPASIRPISIKTWFFFITNVIFHSFIFFSFPFSILIPVPVVWEHDIFQIKRKSFHYLFGNQFHAIWNAWVEFRFYYCSRGGFFCPTDRVSIMEMTAWVIGLVKNHRMLYLHLFYINYNRAII